ncbi:deoxyribodipyrimidine photo-lyase [Pseudodesulfovibrio tunisiensis]|uniref:deoxyribodipyrimidine photo-lyase n=1 Tax=Pseudodesulfovibrio tunisiensis TaxID=463192 RepID=UPI001FB55C48|nr:deoxyribodipyrimidine photo-lyase [Pseudodesulfovibrio tunisiensis]
MTKTRSILLRDGTGESGPVVYWMHREHRARDNWGLLRAQRMALKRLVPVCVVYGLSPAFLEAGPRQFRFLVRGLEETAKTLEDNNIPFLLRLDSPDRAVPELCRELRASAVVTDFDPLRLKRDWVASVLRDVPVPVWETDSRNLVPCRAASDKREYMARTIRPKIHRNLPDFLVEPPGLVRHPFPLESRPASATWEQALEHAANLSGIDRDIPFEPGEDAARSRLDTFIATRLNRYGKGRNVPTDPVVSGLSPYLHFGQISSLRAALEVMQSGADQQSVDAFIEEMIVRRELADNFCLHSPDYDSVTCFPQWAQDSLDAHRDDPRPHLYSLEEFERGMTHDPLWNAAQTEMVRTGYMHGYMRMYWAKKILEWTESPEQAMQFAILLNDRYQLDGRDSNGYTGIAWSIGGVHDRAWKERPVFGKIRFMSYNGAKSKFRIQQYIDAQMQPGLMNGF